jgi:TIR domain
MRSVFMSYRREDSEGQARALKSELVNLIGKDSVFMDVDNIALGLDFRQVLQERLQACDLMLVLIGPDWLESRDAAGRRRLDNDTDLVRQEIAAALKRNIPVTPVLLQGAVMPAPERLPNDIKDLAYRNGFELGHSTWESDVKELVNRLGLDHKRVAGSHASAEKKAVPAIASFRASWVVAGCTVAALAAALLFFVQWRLSSGITESASQATESPLRPSASLPPRQSEVSSAPRPAKSPAPPSMGLGTIRITNLESRSAEVYTQDSSGANVSVDGYVGSITPTEQTLQVPAGTYKLKFDRVFVDNVAVTSGRSREIMIGAISLPGVTRSVEVYEQDSSGANVSVDGYVGSITPTGRTLQVPAGTYKLKFARVFVNNVAVTSGRSREIMIGAISLPGVARSVEVYEQDSSGANVSVDGYVGSITPTEHTLQVPAGTYKLKFDRVFVESVRVEPGKTVTPQ